MRFNPLQYILALAVVLTLSFGLLAEDKKKAGDQGNTGDRAGSGQVFQGQISKVDATKRQITLSNAQQGRGTGTGTGTGTGGAGTGTGTSGSDQNRGTGTSGDRTTGQGKMMTFMLSQDCKITVDGKDGQISDLREGQMARVHVQGQGRSGAGTGTGTGTSGSGTGGNDKPGSGTGGTNDRTGAAGQGATMTADKIEVISRGSGAGSNPGKPGGDR